MKTFPWFIVAIYIVSLIRANSTLARAQEDPANRSIAVQGQITSFKDGDFKISTANGDLLVKLVNTTNLIAENAIKLSEIKPGLFVGVAAREQPDGTFLASAVNVFREADRGLLEGHRPMSSLPNSTMTNATIDSIQEVVVQEVKGPMMTLKYKGGEVKVFVPANTPVTKRVNGDKEMLKPGVTIRVQGSQTADGSIVASQITIRAATN